MAGEGYMWKTKLCWYFEERGVCTMGEECAFAHGQEDLRRPGGKMGKMKVGGSDDEKNEVCRYFASGKCLYGSRCRFVHTGEGGAEDAGPHWKATLRKCRNGEVDAPCHFWQMGRCERGARCPFIHGEKQDQPSSPRGGDGRWSRGGRLAAKDSRPLGPDAAAARAGLAEAIAEQARRRRLDPQGPGSYATAAARPAPSHDEIRRQMFAPPPPSAAGPAAAAASAEEAARRELPPLGWAAAAMGESAEEARKPGRAAVSAEEARRELLAATAAAAYASGEAERSTPHLELGPAAGPSTSAWSWDPAPPSSSSSLPAPWPGPAPAGAGPKLCILGCGMSSAHESGLCSECLRL